MRKIIFAIVTCFSLIGCTKTKTQDDADAFVGQYDITIYETSKWGASAEHSTVEKNKKIWIKKMSSNRVYMSGSFSTFGNVSGNSVLFESTTSSDKDWGSLTTIYDTGILAGNYLTLSMTLTGQLSSEEGGKQYPFNAKISVTGTKQN